MSGKPILLDGRMVAQKIEADLSRRVARVVANTGAQPILATLLVGEDPASVTYVRMKGNACARIGMASRRIALPASATTEMVLAAIAELNRAPDVCGILLQHPVPPQVDEQRCFNAIARDKDVDGVNVESFGAMAMQLPAFGSATPMGIMAILAHYNIGIAGREAVVIGRSPILGKPAAMLLLNADATVTICHSRTRDLPTVVRRADIVVAAVGKPRFIQAEWIKPGAVLIDAGYNPGNIGDIDLENAAARASAYTPVPGGVGPMTIAMLMRQTVESAERRAHLA